MKEIANKNHLAMFALALVCAGSISAQQSAPVDAPIDEEVPIEEQGFVDVSFEDEGADSNVGDTSSGTSQEGASPGGSPRYETLSGVEVEGLSTHSIPLTRLRSTNAYYDSQPVGLMDIALAVPGNMMKRDTTYCTATLIDVDVVMTAYHCFPGTTTSYRKKGFEARGASVTFGYYDEAAQEVTAKVKRVIDADKDLDFAILELDKAPGAALGYVNLSLEPVGDRQLRMFHHPYGYYKMVLQDATCRTVEPRNGLPTRLYHQCDTRGGSSGAAIMSYDYAETDNQKRAIAYGVHVSGRKQGLSDAKRHFNVAVPMTEIAKKSAFVSKIGCRATPIGLECPDRTFIRPFKFYFDWDSYTLSAATVGQLNQFVETMKNAGGAYKFTSISVNGYAENLTSVSAEYEMGISERRATQVANYLSTLEGIDVPINVYARGSSGAEEGRDQEMRRVEIIVDYEYQWY